MTEKRSGWTAADQRALWPDLAAPPPPPGVGGRRAPTRARRGGGGYLNERTPSELRADPRLSELAEIGLAKHWLDVAAIVGYDAFLALWRCLSEYHHLRDDSNQVALTLRPFSRFEKYQRNRYIETLAQAGLKPSQIMRMVETELGEKMSKRQVARLARRGGARIDGHGPGSQSQPRADADTVER